MADLNPAQGSEANKIRPVVIVARNDALDAIARHQRGVLTVVPMTSNERVHGPMHVVVQPTPLNGLAVASKVQAEQIRSLDISRLGRHVGRLSRGDLAGVEAAIRFHLAL
jgi:mRNA interferase MazF